MSFSFASVILSYFLVGGGLFAGALVTSLLEVKSEVPAYALLAAGAAVGGFVASRASRGSTILEPAIGGIAVIASIAAVLGATELGRQLWAVAQGSSLRAGGLLAALGGGGALVGALVSEKLLGEATRSSIPWVIYAALATFGACLLATLLVALGLVGSGEEASGDRGVAMVIAGMASGCLLAGLAVGASARTRPLLASILGGGAGAGGFTLMVVQVAASPRSEDQTTRMLVIAAGGAIATLVGTAIGWAVVGRRGA
jgi:hypothetical protein